MAVVFTQFQVLHKRFERLIDASRFELRPLGSHSETLPLRHGHNELVECNDVYHGQCLQPEPGGADVEREQHESTAIRDSPHGQITALQMTTGNHCNKFHATKFREKNFFIEYCRIVYMDTSHRDNEYNGQKLIYKKHTKRLVINLKSVNTFHKTLTKVNQH